MQHRSHRDLVVWLSGFAQAIQSETPTPGQWREICEALDNASHIPDTDGVRITPTISAQQTIDRLEATGDGRKPTSNVPKCSS